MRSGRIKVKDFWDSPIRAVHGDTGGRESRNSKGVSAGIGEDAKSRVLRVMTHEQVRASATEATSPRRGPCAIRPRPDYRFHEWGLNGTGLSAG